MSLVKSLVSKKKKRFQENGFDLDLSYITPRIVAMGFPAEKFEGVYRNNIEDVLRFLRHYHENHYRIYNLCIERNYDISKFGTDSVTCFPFEDHNPPPFELMHKFCLNAHQYLSAHPSNTIFVHCKAGKGRTGVMIVCYLLYSKICDTLESALEYYAKERTHNKKGVTIPSQIRYIHYYSIYLSYCNEHNLDMLTFYNPPKLILGPVILNCKPFNKISNLTIKISTRENKLLYQHTQDIKKSDEIISFEQPKTATQLHGDVKLEFYQKDIFSKNILLMSVWFNTFFVLNRFGEHASSLFGELLFKKSTSERINFKYLSKIKKTTVLYAEQTSEFSVKDSDHFDWINTPKTTVDRIHKDAACKIFPDDMEIYIGFLKKEYATDVAAAPSDLDQTDFLTTPNPNDGNGELSASNSSLFDIIDMEKQLNSPTASGEVHQLSDLEGD